MLNNKDINYIIDEIDTMLGNNKGTRLFNVLSNKINTIPVTIKTIAFDKYRCNIDYWIPNNKIIICHIETNNNDTLSDDDYKVITTYIYKQSHCVVIWIDINDTIDNNLEFIFNKISKYLK